MPSTEQLLFEKRYLDACYAGNIETVEYMIKKEGRLLTSRFLINCLEKVCDGSDDGSDSINHIKVFIIIHKYITAKVKTFDGFSVLYYACKKGRLEIAMYCYGLLTCNQQHKLSALNEACISGNVNLIKFILTKIDKNNTHYAYDEDKCFLNVCMSGNIESVEMFNNTRNFYNRDHQGYNNYLTECLKNACISGNINIVKLVLLKGKPNLIDCIFSASLSGNIQIIEMLMKLIKPLDEYNAFKLCVFGACRGKHLEIIKLYITKLGKLGSLDIRECINEACRYSNLEIVKYVVSYRSYGTFDWNEHAMYACLGHTSNPNFMEILEFLVIKGATDFDEYLYYACFHNQISLIKMMIKKGATDWNKGLEGACLGSNIKLVQQMIDYGATDLNRGLSCVYGINDIDTDNILIVLLANGADNYSFLCLTKNFKLYNIWLKYKGLRHLELYKHEWYRLYHVYPPCVLLASSQLSRNKCPIKRLPVELFTLLHKY